MGVLLPLGFVSAAFVVVFGSLTMRRYNAER
jgi:hypothetical protein